MVPFVRLRINWLTTCVRHNKIKRHCINMLMYQEIETF
jgi:hypothetical protein